MSCLSPKADIEGLDQNVGYQQKTTALDGSAGAVLAQAGPLGVYHEIARDRHCIPPGGKQQLEHHV